MINIKEIKEKLIEKLRPSGWMKALKAYIISSDFDDVLLELEKEIDNNKRFTPPLKHVFTAFEETEWDNLRVVILGQDPFPQIGIANGVAFDCRMTGKQQPSLKFIMEAIDRTVYLGIPEPERVDLSYLSKQGVLLINTALTTRLDTPLTHQKIWQSFIAYTLDSISSQKKDIVFIFLGKTAQGLSSLVSNKHYKLIASHPASAAYNKLEEWDCKDIFKQTNQYLEDNGRDPIKW